MPEPVELTQRARPSVVTWLSIAVFIMASANIAAVIYGIWRWQVVSPLDLSAPLGVLLVLHGAWAVIWLVIAGGLFTLKPWARQGIPFAFLLYEITIIGQQVLLARSAYPRIRLPFTILLALIGLALIVWIISRPRVVQVFSSAHE
jgi:hypothetical protein